MCTLEKRGDFFFLTLTGDDDHRLSPTALSQAKSQATPGSVLITTSQGKFFTNGLDLAWARAAGSKSAAHLPPHANHIRRSRPRCVRWIHAGSEARLHLHEARSRRLYMSEVDLGVTLPDYFIAMMRSKIESASPCRDVLHRGMKVKGDPAEKMGIVELAHDGEGGVIEAAVALGQRLAKRKWDGEVYSEIRKSMYPEICRVLGLPLKVISSPKL